eukprot:COSAG02_NODE_997_length_15333_cov_13.688526_6_plen_50_part_00
MLMYYGTNSRNLPKSIPIFVQTVSLGNPMNRLKKTRRAEMTARILRVAE